MRCKKCENPLVFKIKNNGDANCDCCGEFFKNYKSYNQTMGLNSRDIGSVKLLRAFVNELLKEKNYQPLKGYKSLKELIAIKLKLTGVIK